MPLDPQIFFRSLFAGTLRPNNLAAADLTQIKHDDRIRDYLLHIAKGQQGDHAADTARAIVVRAGIQVPTQSTSSPSMTTGNVDNSPSTSSTGAITVSPNLTNTAGNQTVHVHFPSNMGAMATSPSSSGGSGSSFGSSSSFGGSPSFGFESSASFGSSSGFGSCSGFGSSFGSSSSFGGGPYFGGGGSTSGFGSSSGAFASPSSIFGVPGGSGFGSGAGYPGMSSPSGVGDSSPIGTRHVAHFQPRTEQSYDKQLVYESICSLSDFGHKSFEELRYEDQFNERAAPSS